MKLEDLKNRHIGVCVSGGLDSKTITKCLKDAGLKVSCFAADLAQPDEKDIRDIKRKMAPCGAPVYIVNLQKQMAEACLKAIKAQAMYDGGYWNTTGIARAVTVKGLLPAMKKRGCSVLSHGATGRGNDQIRLERYTNVLEPDMKVYAPWRDPELLTRFPGRKQMADYLKSCGIDAFAADNKQYSTDANLAGISYEGKELESLSTACTIVKPVMSVWPDQAPDKRARFKVKFKSGIPTHINNKPVSALAAMQTANKIGGANGIGIKHALENRVIGTKSRGVYEAPGMELLGRCLLYLYQAVMDRRAGALFNQLSGLVAGQIYDGRYFDPVTRAAMAAIDTLAEPASGTVHVELYKGNVYFSKLSDCPASLYNEADSSMEASSGLNPVNSQGFVEIQSVEAVSLARAGQIIDKA